MTAAPSSYELVYPDPCDEEAKCGEIDCGGSEFTPRSQVFCQDVTINMDLTVQGATSLGATSIRPPAISVGGQTFTPKVIETTSGPHLVLAVY